MPYSWEHATIPDYEPLEDTTGWSTCPNCNEHPRTWVFDNGNYAKCRCDHKYEGVVAAESIISACHHRGVDYMEWKGFLRSAWNAHCLSLTNTNEEHQSQ